MLRRINLFRKPNLLICSALLYIRQEFDGASSFHPYNLYTVYGLLLVLHLLFVYLKPFKELASVFVVGCVCKGKADFRNHQIFFLIFSEKIFSGGLKRISYSGPALSRSLAMCKVRYSVSAFTEPSGLHPVIRISFLQRVSLSKAVAKVHTFHKTARILCNFFEIFFKLNYNNLKNNNLYSLFFTLECHGKAKRHNNILTRAYMDSPNKKRTHISTKTSARIIRMFLLKKIEKRIQTPGRFSNKQQLPA